jgi:hypothetical protein
MSSTIKFTNTHHSLQVEAMKIWIFWYEKVGEARWVPKSLPHLIERMELWMVEGAIRDGQKPTCRRHIRWLTKMLESEKTRVQESLTNGQMIPDWWFTVEGILRPIKRYPGIFLSDGSRFTLQHEDTITFDHNV